MFIIRGEGESRQIDECIIMSKFEGGHFFEFYAIVLFDPTLLPHDTKNADQIQKLLFH